MNSRERFIETMTYGSPDRVPYFHEGMQPDVIEEWRKQGLPARTDIYEMFSFDAREELEPDLEPHLGFRKRPSNKSELKRLSKALDPMGRSRILRGWKGLIRKNRKGNVPFFLRIHNGFFLTMGVKGWKRFKEVIYMTKKDPEFVLEMMRVQGEFAASLAERAMEDLVFDAAVFTEPIASNHGPLISPKMYEDLVLRSYEPILTVLHRYGVKTIIYLTFANIRLLIPSIIKWGFNCLWACETSRRDMDYRDLRREFGRDLRLIGGIDLDVLQLDKDSIQREVREKVPPLLEEGGYIPLADGRVRKDIPLEKYIYYRRIFEEVTRG